MMDSDGISAWRNTERAALLARRKARPEELQQLTNERVDALLRHWLRPMLPTAIGFYWPIRGEVDLRPLARDLTGDGSTMALPVTTARDTPLLFRRWEPGAAMTEDAARIPCPGVESPIIRPMVLLVPLVGFDDRGFRLGYGGGYYDRTVATLDDRPVLVGIGHAESRLSTIFPQAHDIVMDYVVTEDAVWERTAEGLRAAAA